MVPSLDQATSESYVWAYPGCPVRILLSLSVIEQLQTEASQSAPGRGEIGGLLIRSKRCKPGTIRIVDFVPLPGEQKSPDPHFKLPSESLAEAIARCPSDCKIVGYYRTDFEQRVHLRPQDLDTIQQWFKDPGSVFLVIASGAEGRSTGGFFFWENNSVAANPSLTFPFEAAKLLSEGWPTQAEAIEKEKSGTFTGLLVKLADAVRQMSLAVKIGILLSLFALVICIRVLTWNRPADHEKLAATPGLGLLVKRDGTKFLVAWNPSAPVIVHAKEADLVIWDSSREAWDGSSEPLYMPLTPAQLRSGSVSYTSFSFTEKVKFRLDTIGASGESASESMVSVSPLSPGATAENLAPYEPRRATAPGVMVRSSRAANKKFVPPQSTHAVDAVHDSVIPDPPNMVVQVIAGLAFDSGLLSQSAVAPPKPTGEPRLNPGATAQPPNGRLNEGVVTITSEPSGARVEINAMPAGVTPLTLQITPVGLGFTVTVTKSGFTKWTVQSFSTAQPYSLHAQLREIPK